MVRPSPSDAELPSGTWKFYMLAGVLCALCVGTWSYLDVQRTDAKRASVRSEANRIFSDINADVQARIPALQRIVGRWEASEGTSRKAFVSDASGYLEDLPGFQALSWVDTSFHVRWVVPFQGNEKAQDFYLGANKTRRLALESARKRREPVMSAPIDLVQGGKGFLIFFPIFVKDEFSGFLSAVFRTEAWIEYAIGAHTLNDHMHVSIAIDGTEVFRHQNEGAAQRSDWTVSLERDLMGHHLTGKLEPTVEFLDNDGSNTPEFVAGGTFVFSAILLFMFYLSKKARISASAADEAINELEFQKLALDEHAIVSITDVKGNITYANDKFCEISGYSLDELNSQNHRILKSDEHSPEFYENLWKTIANGNVWNGNIKNSKKGGGFYWVNATIVPFLDDQKKPFKYIAIRTDITDQKETENIIAAAEEQNRLLLTSVGDGIYGLDVNGLTSFVNPAVCEMLGYSEEELIGQPMHSLIHHSFPDGSIYPREECHMYAALKDGIVRNIDNEVLWRKDGSSLPVEYTSTPILRANKIVGAVVTFHDITDRKESENLLRREEMESRLLHQVLEALPETETFEDALQKSIEIICKIGDWSLGHAYVKNDGREDVLTPTNIWYGSDGAASKAFKEITERTTFSLGIGLPGRVLKSRKSEWIVNIHEDENFPRGKNSDIHHLHGAFAFPIMLESKCIAVLEFFQERKATVDSYFLDLMTVVGVQIGQVIARKKGAEEVVAAKEEADKANRAKSEFLSSMSHELRTPMNAILGFAQMLEFNPKEPLSKTQKSSVDLILQGGNHLLDLINDVLDLAKIEAGKAELSIGDVDLNKIVVECLSLTSGMAEGRGIDISVPDITSKTFAIKADQTRTKQVLLNLISNAIKYNRENGKVTISFEAVDSNLLRLSVSDTGPGIPIDRQGELFQAFSRLEAANSKIEGTGIGLLVSKELVELMDGTIGFESEEGKGSTFWFELPLATSQSAHADMQGAIRDAEEGGQLKSINGTMLYVEDNPSNLQLMEMIVSHIDGLTMLSAHTAELGIEIAKSKQPDIIIFDINLPGMSGLDAIKELKRHDPLKDIPVMALSAAATKSDIKNGLEAGFDRYLTKPMNVVEVTDAIRNALEG